MKLISLVLGSLFAVSAYAMPTELSCTYGALKNVCDTHTPDCPPPRPTPNRFLMAANTVVTNVEDGFTGTANKGTRFDLYGKHLYIFAKANFSGKNDGSEYASSVEIQVQDLDTGWVAVANSNAGEVRIEFGRVDRLDPIRNGYIRSTIYCELLP